MGVPFPTGLRRLTGSRRLIGQAWAVNGLLSVVGSVAAVALALTSGYRVVMVAGVIAYGLAFVARLPGSRPAPHWRRPP